MCSMRSAVKVFKSFLRLRFWNQLAASRMSADFQFLNFYKIKRKDYECPT